MSDKKKERLSNIELLRIVAMLMVLTLHYMGQGQVFLLVEVGTVNYYISRIIEAICIVAVNCYVLISAYFLVDIKISINKFIMLWSKVILYSLIIFVLAVSIGWIEPDLKNTLYAFFPLLSRRWSFVTDYMFMYIMSPFLNKGIAAMSKKQHRSLCILLIILLSFVPTIIFWEDTFRVMDGYSPVWFISLYIIASYLKKYKIVFSTVVSLQGYIISALATAGSYFILFYFTQNNGIAFKMYSYNSILTLISSLCLFSCFLNIKIKRKRICEIINKISKLTFGIFLSHSHFAIRDKLWILLGSQEVANSYSMIFHMIGTVLLVFTICANIEKALQAFYDVIGVNKIASAIEKLFYKMVG